MVIFIWVERIQSEGLYHSFSVFVFLGFIMEVYGRCTISKDSKGQSGRIRSDVGFRSRIVLVFHDYSVSKSFL